jgi:5-methylcytosine-specific restriction endonuclease McrA
MPSQVRRARLRAIASGYRGEHFTEEEWAALVDSCGGECLSCGTPHEPLTVDHIVPLSLGGSNAIQNIQPLCEVCNNLKGAAVRDYRSRVAFLP